MPVHISNVLPNHSEITPKLVDLEWFNVNSGLINHGLLIRGYPPNSDNMVQMVPSQFNSLGFIYPGLTLPSGIKPGWKIPATSRIFPANLHGFGDQNQPHPGPKANCWPIDPWQTSPGAAVQPRRASNFCRLEAPELRKNWKTHVKMLSDGKSHKFPCLGMLKNCSNSTQVLPAPRWHLAVGLPRHSLQDSLDAGHPILAAWVFGGFGYLGFGCFMVLPIWGWVKTLVPCREPQVIAGLKWMWITH